MKKIQEIESTLNRVINAIDPIASREDVNNMRQVAYLIGELRMCIQHGIEQNVIERVIPILKEYE